MNVTIRPPDPSLSDTQSAPQGGDDVVHHAYGADVVGNGLRQAAEVLELSGIGMVALDASLVVLASNGTAALVLGVAPDLLRPGAPYDAAIRQMVDGSGRGPDDRAATIRELLDRISSIETWVTAHRSADGRRVEVRAQRRDDGGITVLYLPASLPGTEGAAHPVEAHPGTASPGTAPPGADSPAPGRRRGDAEIYSQRMFDIMNALNQGVAIFSRDRRLTYCNSAYVEHSRLPRGMIGVGQSVDDIVAAKRRHGVTVTAWPAGSGTVPAAGMVRREIQTHADGTVFKIRRHKLSNGGCLVTSIEVTDREHTVEQLRHARDAAEAANRAKSDFMANMSHELRTPLNAIIGFAEIIRGEVFGSVGNNRYVDYANDIVDSAHHLLGLINDILDLSRVESGNITLQDEPLVVADSAVWAADIVRPRARKSNVALSLHLPTDLPKLRADERSLRQILLNLLSNAVKFTPEGGDVRLSADRTADGDLAISVEDTGIGIPADRMQDIIKPFSQVDSSLSRRFEGTGLGLTIVVRLVELHGGRLEIDSVEGEGTLVQLVFPGERIVGDPAGDADPPAVPGG